MMQPFRKMKGCMMDMKRSIMACMIPCALAATQLAMLPNPPLSGLQTLSPCTTMQMWKWRVEAHHAQRMFVIIYCVHIIMYYVLPSCHRLFAPALISRSFCGLFWVHTLFCVHVHSSHALSSITVLLLC